MTSRAEQIRQFLKTQQNPQRASQIAIGINMPGDVRVSHTLGVMCREGSIAKSGTGKAIFYTFVRDAVQRATGADAERNRLEYERRRNEERRKSRADKRAKEGLSDKPKPFEIRKKPAPKPHPSRAAITLAVNTVKARSVAVALEKKEAAATNERPRAETVEEFMARGGKVEKLQPWDTSRPLRLIAERFIDLD